jgi:hypothetical protein
MTSVARNPTSFVASVAFAAAAYQVGLNNGTSNQLGLVDQNNFLSNELTNTYRCLW